MNEAIIITAMICGTLLLMGLIGKIPAVKVKTYTFDEQGICREAKDEYK